MRARKGLALVLSVASGMYSYFNRHVSNLEQCIGRSNADLCIPKAEYPHGSSSPTGKAQGHCDNQYRYALDTMRRQIGPHVMLYIAMEGSAVSLEQKT